MKDYNEDDYLMISGIQHFIFCERQWALIHVEQQWEENYFTIEGQQLHERADDRKLKISRKDIITIHGMSVKSEKLGITGKCDVVELKRSDQGIFFPQYKDSFLIYPVEYKRGKAKSDESDHLQLMAQAVCLEEMLATNINKAYMFYFETRRREEVSLNNEMRKKLKDIISKMHDYLDRGYTPKVRKSEKCRSCSLKNLCLPTLGKVPNVKQYIKRRLEDCDNC